MKALNFPEINDNELKYVTFCEEDMIYIKRLKNILVKSQLYPEAAHLRDLENRMLETLDRMTELGFKPKPSHESTEMLFSSHEVNVMLELATLPLRNSMKQYEEMTRTAIVDHVARLMKEISELKKNQKPVEINGKENEAAGTE